MGVPVKISANPPDTLQGIVTSTQGQAAKSHGPFTVGSNLYLVLSEDQGAGDHQMQVWKSTNGGETWTQKDSGNGPHFLGWYSTVQNSSIIECVYCNLPPGLLRRTTYQEFNTSTDTWGAQSQAANTTDVNGDIWCARLSNGDYLCMYLGFSDAYSIRRTGGVWGSDTSQFPRIGFSSWQAVGLAVDSSDTGYFVYHETVAGVTTLKMRSLTLGGALSAERVISIGNSGATFVTGPCAVWQNGLVVPTPYDEVGFPQAPVSAPGFFFGTPLSAPVWTFKIAGTKPPSPLVMLFLPIDASNARVFWSSRGSPPDSNKVLYSTYNGTIFGPQQLFYDWNLDPPLGGGVVPAADQLLKQLTIAPVSGGYGMALAMAYNYPDEDYSTFYLKPGRFRARLY